MLLVFSFLFLSLPAPLPAAEITTGGFLKSLNLHTESSPGLRLPSGEVSSNRLRGDLAVDFDRRGRFEISAEALLLYTDPADLVPLPGNSPNRTLDLETDWDDSGPLQGQLLIDRLNYRLSRFGADWVLGRQAVGFGRIVLYSPLDVIAPFPPDALDTEVRPGVDALRVSRYFGLAGQASAIAVFGDTGEHHSYLATVEGNTNGIDLLGIGGVLRDRPMAGLGVASQLFGMGVKAEAAFYQGRDVGEIGGDRQDDFVIAGIEADYLFDNELSVAVQYLYNGPGGESPEDYPAVLASAPVQEGLTFLLGRHYLLVAPGYDLHPLVRLTGLLICNLEDDSWFLRPLLNVSLSDNAVLQLFWNVNRGDEPVTSPVLPLPLPRSEFGSAGDSGGVFLKYFF